MTARTPPPLLQGPRVTLRPAQPGDVDARLALGRDPEVHRMYGGSRADLAPLTRADADEWVAEITGHECAWVIVHQRLIGHLRLTGIHQSDRCARLGVGIDDATVLGRGLGTEAMSLALGHAFGTLALNRVCLRTLAVNQRAIRAYQKLGFVIEGRERESALIDGEWHDDLIMGLLAREFLPHPSE